MTLVHKQMMQQKQCKGDGIIVVTVNSTWQLPPGQRKSWRSGRSGPLVSHSLLCELSRVWGAAAEEEGEQLCYSTRT